MERAGNNLSPVIRNAWDGATLSTLTKNSKLRASGTHICAIGHITIEELQRLLTATEAANGFGNRFLWIAVRRSKLLPHGGNPDQLELNDLSTRLLRAAEHSRRQGAVTLTPGAHDLWTNVYEELSTGTQGGLAGALTTRAEPQVVRLSLTYAMLDQAAAIDEQHLRAALALWDYSARSVTHIFGESTGNPDADEILRALRANRYGLTRTDINNLFGRNLTAARIGQALVELQSRGLAYFTTEPTDGRGRPTERWHYGKQP